MAACLGLPGIGLSANTAQASAAAKGKKRKKPSFDVDAHVERRETVQTSARSSADAGDLGGAATELATAAAEGGDPVLYLDAAEVMLRSAREDRDIEIAESSRDPARVALDILHFLNDEHADPDWKVADPYPADSLIDRAESHLQAVDELIAEIEAEQAAALATDENDATDKKKKKKREVKPGTGLIAAGGALAGVGLGGVVVMSLGIVRGKDAQSEVEAIGPVMPGDPDYEAFQDADQRGKSANTLAIAGAVVTGVGIIAGATLIGIGIKKRKAGKQEETAKIWISPTAGGLVLGGRF